MKSPHHIQQHKTIKTVEAIRSNITRQGLEWDEISTFHQLMVLGYIQYATLLGIPHPQAIHEEQTKWIRIIQQAMGVRRTSEPYRIQCKRSNGGLQFTGLVTGFVMATARSLQTLLISHTQAGEVARMQWKQASNIHPTQIDKH